MRVLLEVTEHSLSSLVVEESEGGETLVIWSLWNSWLSLDSCTETQHGHHLHVYQPSPNPTFCQDCCNSLFSHTLVALGWLQIQSVYTVGVWYWQALVLSGSSVWAWWASTDTVEMWLIWKAFSNIYQQESEKNFKKWYKCSNSWLQRQRKVLGSDRNQVMMRKLGNERLRKGTQLQVSRLSFPWVSSSWWGQILGTQDMPVTGVTVRSASAERVSQQGKEPGAVRQGLLLVLAQSLKSHMTLGERASLGLVFLSWR